MDNDKYKKSTTDYADIKGIQFSILSDEEIKKHSVVEIESYDLYEKGCPKAGGLYDLRMGTTDKQYKCQTCNCDIINCPGHFGHIELCEPVFNICFLKTIHKILQCVCLKCSSFLLTEFDNRNLKALEKLKCVSENTKKVANCPVCDYKQPKINMDGQKFSVIIDDETIPISAEMAFQILRKISDEDCLKIGFNPKQSHPRNMIMRNFPVPPPVVRPSIIIDSVLKSQDDLTHKLTEILKCNIQLAKYKESNNVSNHILTEYINLLQFHVNSYIDNEIPGQPQATQRTGRPIKAISQRLKSKEGRVRGNLMGKRVDFSARTVITADPNIKLDELGVPYEIAKNMTIPETVTNYNKEKLQKMVDIGPYSKTLKEVGAKYIINSNGQRKDLRFVKNYKVQIGDIIERCLMDGDYVVFNRQPSLHKMSMMGHKVRVMNNATFRLNLSATSPYNADFDKQ